MWKFHLEEGKTVVLDTDKEAVEVAQMLQSMEASGYVYGHDSIIPVRRVILVTRVASEDASGTE